MSKSTIFQSCQACCITIQINLMYANFQALFKAMLTLKGIFKEAHMIQHVQACSNHPCISNMNRVSRMTYSLFLSFKLAPFLIRASTTCFLFGNGEAAAQC